MPATRSPIAAVASARAWARLISGIAAKGDADRLRPPRHAPHDEETHDAPLGDSDAEGRPRGVPVDGSLTGGSGLEALEKSVGEDDARCHDGAAEKEVNSGLHGGNRQAVSTHVFARFSVYTKIGHWRADLGPKSRKILFALTGRILPFPLNH